MNYKKTVRIMTYHHSYTHLASHLPQSYVIPVRSRLARASRCVGAGRQRKGMFYNSQRQEKLEIPKKKHPTPRRSVRTFTSKAESQLVLRLGRLRTCLVSKKFQDCMSHRIFRHIYRALNIVLKNNQLHNLAVNNKMNLLSIINL